MDEQGRRPGENEAGADRRRRRQLEGDWYACPVCGEEWSAPNCVEDKGRYFCPSCGGEMNKATP